MSIKNSINRRTSTQTFVALPHVVLNHEDFVSLTPRAVKLLLDIANQYRGANNGDLCVAFSVMQKRGWKSKSSLYNAIQELLSKDFIRLTRQGGRKTPALYAITWWSIDECNGKIDCGATRVAPRSFRGIV